jgi:spermidine/putrescine transport system ATP-binding protein
MKENNMQEEVLLSIRGLRKSFDTQDALNGLDLDVYKGEFLTLLGPSGCGKTTTLRIIAGLEKPTEGKVYLENMDLTGVPPEKREVNTVFQNYALFPHMNVEKNIGYGLKMRGVDKKTIKAKVKDMLKLVQLEGYEKRMPSQLSGGQKQRVAIARSAVLEPKLLLLDEPLGALDLQLRRQMQNELKRMQKQLGITFIYITHDQEEALNMSDRIALMNKGLFVQIDTPYDLYEHPKTAFAASFIGETNIIDCTVKELSGREAVLDIGAQQVRANSADWLAVGQKVCLCVRAERLRYRKNDPGCKHLQGKILHSQYTGSDRTVLIELDTGQHLVSRHTTEQEEKIQPGETVCVFWDKDKASIVVDDREKVKDAK